MKEWSVALYVFDEMGQLIASATEHTMVHCCCILNLMEFTLAVFPRFLMQDYELDVQTFNAILLLVILTLRLCEFNEKMRTSLLIDMWRCVEDYYVPQPGPDMYTPYPQYDHGNQHLLRCWNHLLI
ncbi:hypothetical protein ACS0TY_027238 [Phlomoides rotata]